MTSEATHWSGDDPREFSDPPDAQQADGWRELDATEILEALVRSMRARQRQRLIETNLATDEEPNF